MNPICSNMYKHLPPNVFFLKVLSLGQLEKIFCCGLFAFFVNCGGFCKLNFDLDKICSGIVA